MGNWDSGSDPPSNPLLGHILWSNMVQVGGADLSPPIRFSPIWGCLSWSAFWAISGGLQNQLGDFLLHKNQCFFGQHRLVRGPRLDAKSASENEVLLENLPFYLANRNVFKEHLHCTKQIASFLRTWAPDRISQATPS